ncbi:carbon-nitrogen hydrolase family protein [Aquibacillus sediminis]|uniref:carbon-nitrogen hydrolase family protein n=1 Tax=Aquibacillus sediminis TaxID=2574734 RepID=UPI001107C343|nr:carbon-nitrogen hydrolase family protein [Aquibacillus sediminis]
MKVAVAQLSSSIDKQANVEKAKKYITKAKNSGADFIVFPELYMADVLSPDIMPGEVAEPVDGPFVRSLADSAREHQIYVVCGIYETAPHDTQRAYNTTIFLDRSGKLLQAYRKTHLYDAFNFNESDTIIPGSSSGDVIETEFGTVGLMVCYEVRFPEICRKLALDGADFIFMPAAWAAGLMKEDHWQTILKTRAIENTIYVFAADQVGNIFSGRSMIVDPMGVILSGAGEEESLIISEIDIDRIKRVREKLPSVADRKPELYSTI